MLEFLCIFRYFILFEPSKTIKRLQKKLSLNIKFGKLRNFKVFWDILNARWLMLEQKRSIISTVAGCRLRWKLLSNPGRRQQYEPNAGSTPYLAEWTQRLRSLKELPN